MGKNENAIAFYQKWGLSKPENTLLYGDDKQVDFIMTKTLS